MIGECYIYSFWRLTFVKKIKIYREVVYIIAQFGLTFAVAVMAAADFGLSMIVAPSYIISQKFSVFTFGQWDYLIQGLLFIVLCLCMKKFRLTYLMSFLTCVIYGTILDMWRAVIPILNPEITAPGSMPIAVRIILFVFGELLNAAMVALFFKSYIYPLVTEFFVKGMSKRYNIDINKFKKIFDLCGLAVSVMMTLVFFKRFVGIKWGTVVIALINGELIGFFSRLFDKYFETVDLFPRFAAKFKF